MSLIFTTGAADVAKNRTSLITPLELSEQEVLELVEFMKALDGEPMDIKAPKLPGEIKVIKAKTEAKTKSKTKAKSKKKKKKS